MTDLSDALLKALAGSSAQKPLSAAYLTGRLADAGRVVPINELLDAMDDLARRRAVNTARVSGDGGLTFVDVYWLTGVAPVGPGRGITINKHTRNDARAAHEAQARAEASREGLSTQAGAGAASTPLKSPLAPLCKGGENSQETVMPRIAKPAKPVQPAGPAKAANGVVMAQIHAALAGLTEASAAAVDELAALCPAASSLDSVRATLRTLARRGDINTRSACERGKHRAFYWPLPAAGLNDGHEKNLVALRRLGEDDHVAGAGKVIEPDPSVAVAEALGLDAEPEGALRFALWDNGTLLLTRDDEILALPKADTRRLAVFLESCMAVTQ